MRLAKTTKTCPAYTSTYGHTRLFDTCECHLIFYAGGLKAIFCLAPVPKDPRNWRSDSHYDAICERRDESGRVYWA